MASKGKKGKPPTIPIVPADRKDPPLNSDGSQPRDMLRRVGDLRGVLKQTGASWQVNKKLRDGDPSPRYPLGGSPEGRVPASDVAPVDWDKVARTLPSVPDLVSRRLALGLVAPELVEAAKAINAELKARAKASNPAAKKAAKKVAKKVAAKKTTRGRKP